VQAKWFFKLALIIAVTIPCCEWQSPPAIAQEPPSPVDVTFTVEDVCGFPVLGQIRGKQGVIALPDGRLLITAPAETVTLKNLADPSKETTVSITGAFHLRFAENGDVEYVVTGRNILVGINSDSPFVLAIGWFAFTTDAAGNPIQPLTGNGQLIDVCQLLS
jgi:hypothetical protein